MNKNLEVLNFSWSTTATADDLILLGGVPAIIIACLILALAASRVFAQRNWEEIADANLPQTQK